MCKHVTLFIIGLLGMLGFSQTASISGTVSDSGEPLPLANIIAQSRKIKIEKNK